MKVTVVGTGYVGLVTGACLAEMGNHVICMDVDERKIRILNEGGIPIHEPGLKELVQRNVAAGRLQFTTDPVAAVAHGTMQFIGVGTPPDEDGSADMQYVLAAAENIGRHMTDYKVIVDKSTVPVGTADRVRDTVRAALVARGLGNTAFAVITIFAWMAVIENLIRGLKPSLAPWLWGENLSTVVMWHELPDVNFARGPLASLAILLIYSTVIVVAAGWSFQRRDIAATT